MPILAGLGRQILLDGLGGNAPAGAITPAPAALAADPGDGQVALRWTPVAEATSYRVYVSPLPGITPGTATLVAETVEDDYLHGGLVNGATYYYVVTAVGPAGESGYSPEASASPAAPVIDGVRAEAHADVLRLLCPVPRLAGSHLGDTAVEGAALDRAFDDAAALLADMFGDSSTTLLSAWERLLGLGGDGGGPLSDRRTAIVAKLNELGGLSREYYIDYAARLGWTITITEPEPNVWQVNGASGPVGPPRYFRAGSAAAGDRLLSFAVSPLSTIFDDIKPAHTVCQFPVP
jgi:uncharacterized protein YmfQ (DUF2313 family)